MKLMPLALTACLAATALASCAQTPPEPESQRLAREMRSLIGEARCSNDSQCRTVPVGAKACGGPAGYWAWSTQDTEGPRLLELSRRQAEAQKREQEARGMQSDCRVVTDPGATCAAQRCTLNPTSARNAQ